jgi:hypothetical protein
MPVMHGANGTIWDVQSLFCDYREKCNALCESSESSFGHAGGRRRAMEYLMLALTIGLPIVKIVMFPTKAIGRGGNWTIVGAAMIVAMMMALWFGMQSFSNTAADLGTAKASAADSAQQADLDSLAKLF